MLHTSIHLRLERIDPSRRMRRYYQLSLVADLFDQICLVREWGRIGASKRAQTETFQSEAEALTALLALLRVKTRGGYRPAQQGATQQARQQKRSRTQYLPLMWRDTADT